jgi:Uma2 family endonuclease
MFGLLHLRLSLNPHAVQQRGRCSKITALLDWGKNMVASAYPSKMTLEQYLTWEPLQELRYEYVNGEVYAMTGGTIPHNDIALNFYRTLYPRLQSKGCRINVADVKVQVNPNSPYYYPDVVVSCDPRDRNARKFIQSPNLIVEVLSPGTEARDRGEKLAAYRMMPTLQEYVLADSEQCRVECYRRGEGRMWLYSSYEEGESIALESIDLTVSIAALYENVLFDGDYSS